jgi:hypothetical protein
MWRVSPDHLACFKDKLVVCSKLRPVLLKLEILDEGASSTRRSTDERGSKYHCINRLQGILQLGHPVNSVEVLGW